MSSGLDNGLMRNRRQAIIWTNGGLVYWRIYASLPQWVKAAHVDMNVQWAMKMARPRLKYSVTSHICTRHKTSIRDKWLLITWVKFNVLFPKLVLLSSCCQNIMHLWLVVINSLVPGEATWIGGARSALDEVMACCIIAPSHDQGHNSRVSCQKGPIGHA